jgi:hypothetical protein
MVCDVRAVRYPPEETPFDETRLDLLIPRLSKTIAERVCLIE